MERTRDINSAFRQKYNNDPKRKLEWYVIVEDINARTIEAVNLFEYNWVAKNSLIKIAKDKTITDIETFAEKVDRALMHEYWSRCEYEVVVTSWPPYISNQELDRLIKKREEDIADYGKCYRLTSKLDIGEKIDVYAQIKLNWDVFIDYLWNNRDKLKKLKITK